MSMLYTVHVSGSFGYHPRSDTSLSTNKHSEYGRKRFLYVNLSISNIFLIKEKLFSLIVAVSLTVGYSINTINVISLTNIDLSTLSNRVCCFLLHTHHTSFLVAL